jgi:hypothetical protein
MNCFWIVSPSIEIIDDENSMIPTGCMKIQFLISYFEKLKVPENYCIWHTGCNVARGLVQTACTSLNVFFSSMGLTISASKSEVMLFTRKHERPTILVRIGSNVLLQTKCFKYLGIFFSAGLQWSWHVKYVRWRWQTCWNRWRCFLGSASILFDTAV